MKFILNMKLIPCATPRTYNLSMQARLGTNESVPLIAAECTALWNRINTSLIDHVSAWFPSY
jgi:hypothetical protein